MTERTRGSQPSGSPQEAIDLNELHASKTHEQLRASVLDSANTDLASASIQSISVVRLSTRPEKRKLTLSPGASAETSSHLEQKAPKKPAARSNQRHGVFKNPYFPYEGGPLGRLISLLANLMKVVELAVFNNPKDASPLPPQQSTVRKTKKRDASGREIEEEDETVQNQVSVTPRPELE